MGLTAREISDMGTLARLAANPQGTTRAEIYLAVASLYRVQGSELNDRERTLMHEILRRLAKDVGIEIRVNLAERLADDLTVPHELILLLAYENIEVARPVLLRSPLLSEEDMLGLIAECGCAHQEALASRSQIGERVGESLARSGQESVLMALVQNVTARFSHSVYDSLVEKSRTLTCLQEPLARRPDLPPKLAVSMCEFASDAVRADLSQHYIVGGHRLNTAGDRDEPSVQGEAPETKSRPAPSAQKLIDKLAAAGQLKAGFLLRVLHQGQTDLFDLALARLVDLPLTELRAKFYQGGPKAVALACRAVGIDRCVFPTVFDLSRQTHNMRTTLGYADIAEVDRVFATVSRPAALTELSHLTFN